jgi:hypothetical protein
MLQGGQYNRIMVSAAVHGALCVYSQYVAAVQRTPMNRIAGFARLQRTLFVFIPAKTRDNGLFYFFLILWNFLFFALSYSLRRKNRQLKVSALNNNHQQKEELMARTPQASFSTARLIILSERSCRLCGQAGNGSQKYSTRIAQARETLEQRQKTAEAKAFERVLAYDAMIAADNTLDDAVRSAFEACKTYERNNNFTPVVEKAFPGGIFTPIVRAPREKQADLVRQVIACLRQLEPENSDLSRIASDLETALQPAVAALESLEQKGHEAFEAEALEKLGKKEFVETYTAIYHEAYSDLGRKRANKLFPVIWNGKKQVMPDQKTGKETLRAAA